MKKVLVISCFYSETNASRPYLVYKYFKDKHQEVKVIYSQFSHSHKDYIELNNNDYIGVRPLPYTKNLSLKRILSHIDFSLKTVKIIKLEVPDLVYINIPPNFLGYQVVKICKKYNINVITDIIDIWPEALPIPSKINNIFMNTLGIPWKWFRKYALDNSEYIISESKYFIDKLKINYDKIEIIHLCKILKSNIDISLDNVLINNTINIAYLGAMNYIYDFENLIKMCKLICKTNKVKLHIIGDGERREWLIGKLKEEKINYKYYGKVYDEDIKRDILSKCDFGFNGYKSTTEVALSYKSVDYLSYGLLLINSACGDTWNIIEENKIGFNYKEEELHSLVNNILNLDKENIYMMRQNSINVFKQLFCWNIFINKMDKILNIFLEK